MEIKKTGSTPSIGHTATEPKQPPKAANLAGRISTQTQTKKQIRASDTPPKTGETKKTSLVFAAKIRN